MSGGQAMEAVVKTFRIAAMSFPGVFLLIHPGAALAANWRPDLGNRIGNFVAYWAAVVVQSVFGFCKGILASPAVMVLFVVVASLAFMLFVIGGPRRGDARRQ